MDALFQGVGNFGDKLFQGPIAVFVPWRNDFDESHDAPKVMANRDAIGLVRVIGLVRMPVDPRFRPFEYSLATLRRFVGAANSTVRASVSLGPLRCSTRADKPRGNRPRLSLRHISIAQN